MFLIALLYEMYPPQKITVVMGDRDKDADRLAHVMAHMPLYADVTILNTETAQYPLLNGKTTYYVCKNHTCLPPMNEEEYVYGITHA